MGGVVRDALLGREARDVDVAVAAEAQPIGRALASLLQGRFVPLDTKRDLARVVVTNGDGVSYVDISPVNEEITQDLRRRDFTVDAIALPLVAGASAVSCADVIDPHGGVSDLTRGVIKAVDPSVFEADPARLLRAPRLSAQLQFEIDAGTKRQIRQHAPRVTMVAPERIRDETLKLLAEPGVTCSLRLLDDLDLLGRVIPELSDARGVTQPREHRWDVFDHMVETAGEVERVVSAQGKMSEPALEEIPRFDYMSEYFAREASDGHTRLTILKLAGLLHDIAKPATRTVEDSGRIRFLGHHAVGAEVAETILTRLRFSRRGVEMVRHMVHNHLRPGQMAQRDEQPTARAIYRYFRDAGDTAIDTLYLNLADYRAARGPYMGQREWSDHCVLIGHIMREGLERKAPETLSKLIDGHDIMDAFPLGPGPKVGSLLLLVQEAQAGGEISTRDEALELVRANLGEGGDRA